jgi:rhamnogalacturonyl hydrolase YesR
VAIVDTLDYLPSHHLCRARLLIYLQNLADAIVLWQDQSYKDWYIIMDPGMKSCPGNLIVSSASAIFVHGLFKSLHLGYISGELYEAAATSDYELMIGTFSRSQESDGSSAWLSTIQTGSLSSNGTFEVRCPDVRLSIKVTD